MQLSRLRLTNWLCHTDRTFELAPLTFITGPNGSGKSAIADAIAFVLDGTHRRVTLKGDRPLLIREGATSKGVVAIDCQGSVIIRDVASAKSRTQGGPLPLDDGHKPEAIPYVLDRSRFAAIPPDERRKLLRIIMAADLGPHAILALLRERQHPEALVSQLRTTASLDDWISLAKTRASEGRGGWKALTGEAYGTEKGAAWQAPLPEDAASREDLARYETELAALQAEADGLNRAIGTLDAAERQDANRTSYNARLRELADKAPDAMTAYQHAKVDLEGARIARDRARDRHTDLVARLDTPHLTCPDCGTALDHRDGRLHRHAAIANQVTPDDCQRAAAELTTSETRLASLELQYTAAETQNAQCQAALEESKRLPAAGAAAKPDRTREDLDRQLAAIENDKVTKGAVLMATRELCDEVDRAGRVTAKALEHHTAVLGWVAIEAALAPDGIPGEILERLLGPFNAELRSQADASGWPLVTIGADMVIRAGGRPHALLSRSEQWRTDAMLAVAIAALSGIAFVVLDEFDVLDVPSRRPAMVWLYQQVTAGILDTCIVLATMKEPPQVPAGVACYWLGEHTKERKAA